MSDQPPEFNDAEFHQEQRDFEKREGMTAYIDMIMDLLGDKVDPAKRALIREGFMTIFERPTPAAPIFMPSMPSPYFEETQCRQIGLCMREETTIWNWASIMQTATHATRYEDGNVSIWKAGELLLDFGSARPAAKAFWEWYTAISNFNRTFLGGL